MNNTTRLPKRGFGWIVIALSLALGLALGPAQPARAADCTVTSAADSGGSTLRARLADSACAVIDFAGDTTILLASPLALDRNVTIDGAGHSVVISGDTNNDDDSTPNVPIFEISAGVAAALQNLTLEKGSRDVGSGEALGGAIYNAGTLAVTNATFSGNIARAVQADGLGNSRGGAIYNDSGTLKVTNSTFSGNISRANRLADGGAIYNDSGTLTVTNSTFSGNEVDSYLYNSEGGALYNHHGTLTVTDSTFSGNSALIGGVIFNEYLSTVIATGSTFSANSASHIGGVIYNENQSMVMATNNTFIGNSAVTAGGVLDNTSSAQFNNNTFVENTAGFTGGAYFSNYSLTLYNNIIARGSTGNSCISYYTFAGDGNLANDPTCGTGFTQSASLLLGPLGDNGGPTLTIPLLAGSPALEAADSSYCPAADQRGVTRPQPAGTKCDAGAFESDIVVPDTQAPVVTVPADMNVSATGAAGAVVNFTATATDDVDGPLTPVCDPPSGSLFPIGATKVTCTASDSVGNSSSASFKVTVQDTTPPVVTVPGDMTVSPTSAYGARVTFTATAADNVDGPLELACTPASGSLFPRGSTQVTCTATDAAGNPGSASFKVTVAPIADLKVTSFDSKDPVKIGTSMFYTLKMTNLGPNTTQKLKVVAALDPNTSYLFISASPGWSCKRLAGVVSCTKTSLVNGSTVIIKIYVRVRKATPAGTTLVNTTQVSSAAYDPLMTNNTVVQKTATKK